MPSGPDAPLPAALPLCGRCPRRPAAPPPRGGRVAIACPAAERMPLLCAHCCLHRNLPQHRSMSAGPVKAVPVTVADTPVPVSIVPGQFNIPLMKNCCCGGGPAACAACCCPCCLLGVNDKMLHENRVITDVCCGGVGTKCLIHGLIGGSIQGAAIFILGPLAALVHFGSLVACCTRGEIRAKYNIPGDKVSDCCTHYCCSQCALGQEYDELVARIQTGA